MFFHLTSYANVICGDAAIIHRLKLNTSLLKLHKSLFNTAHGISHAVKCAEFRSGLRQVFEASINKNTTPTKKNIHYCLTVLTLIQYNTMLYYNKSQVQCYKQYFSFLRTMKSSIYSTYQWREELRFSHLRF